MRLHISARRGPRLGETGGCRWYCVIHSVRICAFFCESAYKGGVEAVLR